MTPNSTMTTSEVTINKHINQYTLLHNRVNGSTIGGCHTCTNSAHNALNHTTPEKAAYGAQAFNSAASDGGRNSD